MHHQATRFQYHSRGNESRCKLFITEETRFRDFGKVFAGTNQQSESTHENLLLTLPRKNRTNPVTTHAALNKVSLPRSGNEVGMITYPSRGIAPNAAKEQNMTKPEI